MIYVVEVSIADFADCGMTIVVLKTAQVVILDFVLCRDLASGLLVAAVLWRYKWVRPEPMFFVDSVIVAFH